MNYNVPCGNSGFELFNVVTKHYLKTNGASMTFTAGFNYSFRISNGRVKCCFLYLKKYISF